VLHTKLSNGARLSGTLIGVAHLRFVDAQGNVLAAKTMQMECGDPLVFHGKEISADFSIPEPDGSRIRALAAGAGVHSAR
jgi:hypothetical protein